MSAKWSRIRNHANNYRHSLLFITYFWVHCRTLRIGFGFQWCYPVRFHFYAVVECSLSVCCPLSVALLRLSGAIVRWQWWPSFFIHSTIVLLRKFSRLNPTMAKTESVCGCVEWHLDFTSRASSTLSQPLRFNRRTGSIQSVQRRSRIAVGRLSALIALLETLRYTPATA